MTTESVQGERSDQTKNAGLFSKDISSLSYKQAVVELEKIIAGLDDGTIDVDSLGERFARATEIVEELDKRITETKAKVEQLVPRLEAVESRKNGNISSNE